MNVHVAQALLLAAFVFPRIAQDRRRHLTRRWSLRLLAMLGIEHRIIGLPESGLPGNLLIVANHVSWLDIFVLNALEPARFVGKAELKRWPIIGRLIANAGTLFIERERRRDAHKVNIEAARVLAAGDVVAIFPEGTTTDGRDVLPFRASLLQPIVDAGGHVQPVAIRYRDHEGGYTDAPLYVGDTTFPQSFWRVCGEHSFVVEMEIGEPLPAAARHRRDLAREAEAIIRRALAPRASGSPPGTSAHRRDGSR